MLTAYAVAGTISMDEPTDFTLSVLARPRRGKTSKKTKSQQPCPKCEGTDKRCFPSHWTKLLRKEFEARKRGGNNGGEYISTLTDFEFVNKLVHRCPEEDCAQRRRKPGQIYSRIDSLKRHLRQSHGWSIGNGEEGQEDCEDTVEWEAMSAQGKENTNDLCDFVQKKRSFK